MPLTRASARTVVLLLRVKGDDAPAAARAGAGIGGRDDDRAVGPLRAGADVQGVQALDEGSAVFLGARHEVDRSRHRINHGRADNAHVAAEILVIAATGPGHVGVGRRDYAGAKKGDLPVRGAH